MISAYHSTCRSKACVVLLVLFGFAMWTSAIAQEIMEQGSMPGHLRIVGKDVPVSKMAATLVRVTGMRIDGHEQMGDTLISLRFENISAAAVMQVLADAAGMEARRHAEGMWRVGRPENQDLIEKQKAAAARAREVKDYIALERALTRIVELAPASSQDGMDALPTEEFTELIAILHKREDYAAAERILWRWLELLERNTVLDFAAETLLDLGWHRVKQKDFRQARALFERALNLMVAEEVSASLATRARIALASVAASEGRVDAAESLQTQALAGLKGADADDDNSAFHFYRTDNTLLGQLFGDTHKARDYARVERILARRIDFYNQFPQFSSMRLFDLELLGESRISLNRLPEAREAFDNAIAIIEKSGSTGKAEYPNALYQRAAIDVVMGRYREALKGWQRLCGLRHAILGSDHRSTLTALGELATLGEMAATTASLSKPVACPAIAVSPPVSTSSSYALRLEGDLFSKASRILSKQIALAKAASPSKPLHVASLLEHQALMDIAQRRSLERSFRR